MTLSKQELVNLLASKGILLPRGYLSWSALNLLETSEKQYCKKYFDGEDTSFSNTFMTFGKRFASAKETGNCDGDLMLEFCMNAVPAYKFPEFNLKAEMTTPYGIINLLAIPDSFDDIEIATIEYKTGKVEWTHERVRNHGQLHFYAVACYIAYKKNPRQTLWWIETVNTSDGVRPTGKIESFEFMASDVEIKEMVRRITRACLKIDKLYRQHLSQKLKSYAK